MTLPPGKIEEQIEQIRHFLVPGATFTYKEAVVLEGQLTHVSYLFLQLKCYLRGLYRWKMEWVNHAATRPAPDRVLEDLLWREQTLLNFTSAKLIPDPDPTNVRWYGNASTSYGVGVLIGKRWGQFRIQDEA